ncbi:MAG: alpha/beta fold hydrolase [Deltaproteobacteria bacterium]|nr:alpha/beta fold hydrolase [Deltaproteobacteria bacterium]
MEHPGWHPASRFLELELGRHRVRAHVVDQPGPTPDAPTAVLIHGIGQSSWAWRKNIEALAEARRVVAICQKGHGWSGRGGGGYSLPDLATFVWRALDRLGVARAAFVGNSLGGAVALYTAIHDPWRVERLLLVDPAAHADQRPWGLLKTQVAALAPVYRALIGPTVFRIPLRLLAYRGIPVDRDYMAGFWAPFEAPGSMRALVAVARALPRGIADLEARLAEVRQPTLVVWGEEDAVLPVGGAWRLIHHVRHARLVIFPGVGHCPQEEAHERFNALAREFLRG